MSELAYDDEVDDTPPAEAVKPAVVDAAAPVATEKQIAQVYPVLYRFTVDQYLKAADLGIFPPNEKIELIEGVIRKISPSGPNHGIGIGRIIRLLRGLEDRAFLVPQSTVRFEKSAPEPDLYVMNLQAVSDENYAKASDIYFVVEFSSSSLSYDRGEKLGIYAAEGILEYWIVNLQAKEIEVYREPNAADRTYGSKQTFKIGDRVAPLAFPDYFVSVSDVFASP